MERLNTGCLTPFLRWTILFFREVMSVVSLFLIVFGTLTLVFVLMAVGIVMGREPISGSCGGMAAKGLSCFFCPKKKQCKKKPSLNEMDKVKIEIR